MTPEVIKGIENDKISAEPWLCLQVNLAAKRKHQFIGCNQCRPAAFHLASQTWLNLP